VRAESGPITFYKEAIASLCIFTDREGTLVDAPNMVKTAYRLFIATVVTTPKSVSHSLSHSSVVTIEIVNTIEILFK
jgi:hypothetical protein